jgi:hypothetical protein
MAVKRHSSFEGTPPSPDLASCQRTAREVQLETADAFSIDGRTLGSEHEGQELRTG